MEHSRLFKFLLPARDTNNMADPERIKFDYQDPVNVEAEVPGSQTLREGQFDDSPSINGETGENSSQNGKDSSQNGEDSSQNGQGSSQNKNDYQSSERITTYSEVRSIDDDGKVITRHRQIFSGKRNGIDGEPVMMEGKIEDRRARTKIPVSRFRQTVERVKAERRETRDKDLESHTPVRRSSIPIPVNNQKDSKHPSTTVKKEITITKTVTRKESTEPTITKIEIRKETSEPSNKTTDTVKTVEATEPEDEFDKIYAEIVVNTPTEVVLDDSLLSPNVDDPDRLESKFEEIIHDYDEHKVEPIDVEVVRRSKIPYLKRMSQQDVELNAQSERTSKIIAARDKLRLRHSLNKGEDFENELDKELNKAETNVDTDIEKSSESAPKSDTKVEKKIDHKIITSPNSKTEVIRQFTKTISTSSSKETDNVASSSTVETTSVREVTTDDSTDKKENKQYFMTEENVMKGCIKIGIPVFDSYVHEVTEKNETAKTVEVKQLLSYTSKTEDLSIKNNVNKIEDEITETKTDSVENNLEQQVSQSTNNKIDAAALEKNYKSFDKSVNGEKPNTRDVQEPAKAKEPNAENGVKLRSKVKTDSRELIEVEPNKRESLNELKKKKSVMSKIAMFERKETEEPILGRVPRKETKLPKLLTKEWQEVEHVHVHKPLILFNPLQKEPILTKVPRNETKLPKLFTKDWHKVEHEHVHTPLIVDEVFKPFQADIDIKNEHNKEESPLKSDTNFETIVKAERIILESPNTVYYAAENKVQIETKVVEENKPIEEVTPIQGNIDTEYTAQKVEIATITNLRSSRSSTITNDLAPPSKHLNTEVEEKKIKRESFTKLSMAKELQAPVIIPGFKPVSELLRSFETNKDVQRRSPKRAVSKIEYTFTETETPKITRSTSTIVQMGSPKYTSAIIETPVNIPETVKASETIELPVNIPEVGKASETFEDVNETYDEFESVNDYKSLDDVFSRDSDVYELRQEDNLRRAKSLAELDLGDVVKGKVNNMILRMKSVDRIELDRREVINKNEMPRKRSVSEKIALFEGKLTPSRGETLSFTVYKTPNSDNTKRTEQNLAKQKPAVTDTTTDTVAEFSTDITHVTKETTEKSTAQTENADAELMQKIEELRSAKEKYGTVKNMARVELSNGMTMPALAVGTALLDPRLTFHIVSAAIDLGYRAIDTAYIYGTEKQVGEAIRAKIADGTVKREDLFIISKLWSTFHRTDLVEVACRASLEALGLDYFDLFLIHNPMSFKEGGSPIPKIATVIQYSEYDYLDAWYGMEQLVSKGIVRAIGVSNFNSVQLQRVLDKGRVKPVVNQVECHPYLSQQRLGLFCSERNVTLSCFGTLGSKGTPLELKSGVLAAIDDPLVQVMASGLGISPAQLLLSYQLENGHGVVVKSSSGAHLWDNLRALSVRLTSAQVDAMHALNRNKRTFTFKGMGDTHRNYPFNTAF